MLDPKIADSPVMRLRHSLSHIMAKAVLQEFPEARLGTGPALDTGFYYDFELPRPINDEDLKNIEKRMYKIINKGESFEQYNLSPEDAKKQLTAAGQTLKNEIVDDLVANGETQVSFYKTGDDFADLCAGPHLSSTKEVPQKCFTLDKFSAAYWRADEKRESMQRIYGLAFETAEELQKFMALREEAKKRDHRKLGKELGLFTIVDEVGAGLPLFYPKGAMMRRIIENFISEMQEKRGYVPIWIPHITKGQLYEISGHLAKYDAMYPPMHLEGESDYYLKPMNCPHFMMLYKSLFHSYRDLPVRYVCTTTNYRYEKSGELSGLTRVRALTQDDCHVFVTPDQIGQEINLILDMLAEVYQVFGFSDFYVRISTHDPANFEKYIGDKEIWKSMESTLEKLIDERGWTHEVGVGEAAFYGPKLDFMFKDVLGREWQLSTVQLDMNLPKRFELEYIDAEGNKQVPVVIHRAILGSVERFMGIMIEHFGGVFPAWLAPVQVAIIPIADAHAEAAAALEKQLKDQGFRVEMMPAGSDSLGKRVRAAEQSKIPYMLVLGEKEIASHSVALRSYYDKQQTVVSQSEFIARLGEEVDTRALPKVA